MSKMLTRAHIDLEMSKEARNRIKIDDIYLNNACSQLHQSIEMMLKGYIELLGKNYIENHNLKANIKVLYDLGVDIPVLKEIEKESKTITDWYYNNRYNKNFYADTEDYDRYVLLADELLKEINSLVDNKENDRNEDIYDLIPESFKSLFNTKEECINAWEIAHPKLK